MFRLWDKTTFCIFSNTSLPLGTPTRLRIVLSSSLLYPPNTSITMLNCFTWYPGNCLFNSSPSGAYFSVFSTALGIFVVQPRIAHLQQGDRFCCAVHYPGVNSVGSYRHMPHGLHIQGHPRTLALGHHVLVNSSREHPPPGKPRAFVARWVPGAGHLAVHSVPVPRAFANNKNLAKYHPVAISEGVQSQGFQAVKHCHFGVGEEHLSTIKDL